MTFSKPRVIGANVPKRCLKRKSKTKRFDASENRQTGTDISYVPVLLSSTTVLKPTCGLFLYNEYMNIVTNSSRYCNASDSRGGGGAHTRAALGRTRLL